MLILINAAIIIKVLLKKTEWKKTTIAVLVGELREFVCIEGQY